MENVWHRLNAYRSRHIRRWDRFNWNKRRTKKHSCYEGITIHTQPIRWVHTVQKVICRCCIEGKQMQRSARTHTQTQDVFRPNRFRRLIQTALARDPMGKSHSPFAASPTIFVCSPPPPPPPFKRPVSIFIVKILSSTHNQCVNTSNRNNATITSKWIICNHEWRRLNGLIC